MDREFNALRPLTEQAMVVAAELREELLGLLQAVEDRRGSLESVRVLIALVRSARAALGGE
jgi:hypothetical protein